MPADISEEQWRESIREEFAGYMLTRNYAEPEDLEGEWDYTPRPLQEVLRRRAEVVRETLRVIRIEAWESMRDPKSYLEDEPYDGTLSDQSWGMMREEIEESERQLGSVIVLQDTDLDRDGIYAYLRAESRGWMVYAIPNGWVFAAACIEFSFDSGPWDELLSELESFAADPAAHIGLPAGYDWYFRAGRLSLIALDLTDDGSRSVG
jgi:hypothetical protein